MEARARKVRKLLARSGLRKRGRPGSAAPLTRRPPGKGSGPGRSRKRQRPPALDLSFRKHHLAETRRKPLHALRKLGYDLEAQRYSAPPSVMRGVMRLACLGQVDLQPAYRKAFAHHLRLLPKQKG